MSNASLAEFMAKFEENGSTM